MTTLTTEQKQQWVAALRSGKYNKCIGALHNLFRGNESYCPLGVLIDIVKPGYFHSDEQWHGYTELKLLGFTDDVVHQVYRLNDTQHYTFDEIADWIEKDFTL